MTRYPKNPPQTANEIIEDVVTTKATKSHHYKVQGDEHRAEVLSALIKRSAGQLAEADKVKIPLSDAEAVKAQAFRYLAACEQAGAFPSVIGLSRSLGCTRRALYKIIDERTYPATADFLELFRDMCSDILSESALTNNANTVATIFIQKAVYGLRESVELVVTPPSPLGESTNPEQIKRLVDALPEADYEISE